MLFKQFLCEQIKAGKKTVTRRLVEAGDTAVYNGDGQISAVIRTSQGYPAGRAVWEVGKVYAYQPGMGKPGLGYIRITGIFRRPLWRMAVNDMLREGVEELPDTDEGPVLPPLAPFIQLWDSLAPKGKKWTDNPEVWVIEFERVTK